MTGASGQYQGKKCPGLFSIEGDTLKRCSGNDRAKGRPAALKTNAKDGHSLDGADAKEAMARLESAG